MDSDFKPAKRPAGSLRKALDERLVKTPTPEPTTFKTPEETAAEDDIAVIQPDMSLPESGQTTPAADSRLKTLLAKLKIKWPLTEKEWLVSAAIIVVCGSILGFVLTKVGDKPVASASHVKVHKPAPKPKTVPSTLSGLQVDPSLNKRPVTGVMIENSQDARPQSGLSEAGVVFEAIAEGGITRFLALFQDTAPGDVGPVRSARPYYVQWAQGFDAGYAHVGGSPEALADIKAWGIKDLDQFANAGSYHRVSTRAAPHNVYTGISTLNELETAKGYTSSTFTGFVRKTAAPTKTPPAAKSIDLKLSGPLYNVHYDYAAATNSYNRSEGGAAHIDANGSKVISPTVVVAISVPYAIASDGHHSEYQTIGSGTVHIFQDGNVVSGTWSKPSGKDQIVFTDAAGKPLKLNPGQTWITAVTDPTKISYVP